MLAKAIKRIGLSFCSLAVLLLSCSALPSAYMSKTGAAVVPSTFGTGNDGPPSYLEWINTTQKDAADAPSGSSPIRIDAAAYAKASDPSSFEQEGTADLLWKEGESWVEYEVRAPADGMYNLALEYDSADDTGLDMTRGVQIDGNYPYAEAENVVLKREFVQSAFPFETDSKGNERGPVSTEAKGWKTQTLADYSSSAEPLKFYLKQGTNAIRLIGTGAPIKLRALLVQPPENVPTYAEASKGYAAADGNGKWIGKFEAENPVRKSNASITVKSSVGTLMSPESNAEKKYNNLGGKGFSKSGQWVEWEFEVPKDGRYEIGFRYLQMYVNYAYAYRKIEIDGKPLFQELQSYGFPYDSKWQWQGMTLSGEDGAPFLFDLAAGKHTMRMTATAAPNKLVYEGILRNLNNIGDLNQQIRKVTGLYDKFGGSVDYNRTWDLEKYIPDIAVKLRAYADDLVELADLQALSTMGQGESESNFRNAATDLIFLADHAGQIPNRLDWFEKMTDNLSLWISPLMDESVGLDYFWVAEPGADAPRITPTWWQNVGGQFKRLIGSYGTDYDYRGEAPNSLDVWVTGNRDTADIIQRLADDGFTRETGIPVNVNITAQPQQQFILSNIAGDGPDVALSIGQTLAGDLGIRGALADLSKMPDYGTVKDRFHPGALIPYHYDGKDFALPDQQSFNVMIYRTDVFDDLGIKPPNTWDDVIRILPAIQQKGYNMSISSNDYQTFLYQNGAELYAPDGLQSALDSDNAYKGFKKWADMFTLYQMPKNIPNLYASFKRGDVPIAVFDFGSYILLSTSAPELTGKWKLALIPGTPQEDGTIARWSPGYTTADAIFEHSDQKENAWRFLQWWSSADTQTELGNEIESSIGPEYRRTTANLEAFSRLPWPRDDLNIILEQRKWYKEAVQVPGSYMTDRLIPDALKIVTLTNQNPREVLENAVLDINREMKRKQREFNLRDGDGNVLKTLDIPFVDKPWDGGSR